MKSNGEHFIVIDLSALALRLADQLDPLGVKKVVGVGKSGTRFARYIDPECRSVAVRTLEFNRQREKRQLEVTAMAQTREDVLVDDLAVSGKTLADVLEVYQCKPKAVAVGMALKSKRLQARVAIDNFYSALEYSREGGGNPPINSISTLVSSPVIRASMLEKYTPNKRVQIEEILTKGIGK